MSWLTLDIPHPRLWERFRAGTTRVGESAARAVEQRWQRVRALGADPDAPAEPIEDATALVHRRDALGPLLRELPDVLAPATQAFAARDFVLLVADPTGVVIEQLGGGSFADEARRVRLMPGTHWSEATRGTNAIGTAIAERRPVAVHGLAHWARPNHGLVCYAAPVFDPAGELVAVLDATSFDHRADPFAQLVVHATARALEERLRSHAYARAQPLAALSALLRDGARATWLVARPGTLHAANDAAQRLLRGDGSWSWPALEHAAQAGTRALLRDHAGALCGEADVEPIFDPHQRLIAVVVRAAQRQSASLAPARPRRGPFDALHGSDATLQQARDLAARLAPTDLPLLLLAETGTGKELLARAIHQASTRASGPFVALNCGAISESLLDSELFGYGPGAFTGALRTGRDGHLATAHGGTLFLDELAEMPSALQARLLRVLEHGVYRRVGESNERHADVRLLAATCADLPALVRDGRFRADLYYRLRGATLTLPPVRDRADLPALCDALLADLAAGAPSTLTDDARAAISSYAWPGNIRELKHALRVALLLADGARLTRDHLPPELRDHVANRAAPATVAARPTERLAEVERDAIMRALATANDNRSEAARQLGVSRSTLYRMLERYGLT